MFKSVSFNCLRAFGFLNQTNSLWQGAWVNSPTPFFSHPDQVTRETVLIISLFNFSVRFASLGRKCLFTFWLQGAFWRDIRVYSYISTCCFRLVLILIELGQQFNKIQSVMTFHFHQHSCHNKSWIGAEKLSAVIMVQIKVYTGHAPDIPSWAKLQHTHMKRSG